WRGHLFWTFWSLIFIITVKPDVHEHFLVKMVASSTAERVINASVLLVSMANSVMA
uniref:MFS transporter n=1 Tax=Haemonchus contortus TaxID=6289 RepID=A0A7I4XXA3_HAECO